MNSHSKSFADSTKLSKRIGLILSCQAFLVLASEIVFIGSRTFTTERLLLVLNDEVAGPQLDALVLFVLSIISVLPVFVLNHLFYVEDKKLHLVFRVVYASAFVAAIVEVFWLFAVGFRSKLAFGDSIETLSDSMETTIGVGLLTFHLSKFLLALSFIVLCLVLIRKTLAPKPLCLFGIGSAFLFFCALVPSFRGMMDLFPFFLLLGISQLSLGFYLLKGGLYDTEELASETEI